MKSIHYIKYTSFFFALFIQLKLIGMTASLLIEGKQILKGRRPKSEELKLKRSKSELELKRNFRSRMNEIKLRIPVISSCLSLSPRSPSLSPREHRTKPIWEIVTCFKLSPRLNDRKSTYSANPIGVESSKKWQSRNNINTSKLPEEFYDNSDYSIPEYFLYDGRPIYPLPGHHGYMIFTQKPSIPFNEGKINRSCQTGFPGHHGHKILSRKLPIPVCADAVYSGPIWADFPGAGYIPDPEQIAYEYECKKLKLK